MMTMEHNMAQQSSKITDHQPIIKAFLHCVAEHGYVKTSLEDITKTAKLPLSELLQYYSTKACLLSAYNDHIDQSIWRNMTPYDSDETMRDRLFDIFMKRYDALKSDRAAIAHLKKDAVRDPFLGMQMSALAMCSLAKMMNAIGLNSDGLKGHIRIKALFMVHQCVLSVFLKDDDADLTQTMKALDEALGKIESTMMIVKRFTPTRSQG
jgi:AcrR family transcriptional regulator